MKLLFAFAVSLFSFSAALACPDLTGAYECTTASKKKFKLKVEQTSSAPISYYFIDLAIPKDRSDYVVADGRTYKIGKTKKSTKAWCEGEVLMSITKGTDSFMGEVEYHTSISKTDGVLTIDREDKSDFPIGHEFATCH